MLSNPDNDDFKVIAGVLLNTTHLTKFHIQVFIITLLQIPGDAVLNLKSAGRVLRIGPGLFQASMISCFLRKQFQM